MARRILHYIYDPYCGWCYAAAPLVRAARGILPVRAHGGGMLAGPERRPVTPQLRDYVIPHDRRIAQVTGQVFGAAYFDELLRDPGAIFDSEVPIAAVLAADQQSARGLDLLARIQVAHYVHGQRIASPVVLIRLAEEIGLDRTAFATAFAQAQGDAVQSHIDASRRLLSELGGSGFPTLAVEADGALERLDISRFIGRPDEFGAFLALA
jgi:putative protein-disulfide isomerase